MTIHLQPARHQPAAAPKQLLAGDSFSVSAARRALDLLVAPVGLLVALPALAVAALLILVTDGRPVMFRQRRIGEGGRPFLIYKLRTMRREAAGPGVTVEHDARVTRVGTVLRRLSVDELPQLWHVLRGQMTLVGPRPESEGLAAHYPAYCRPVLCARPGLTGPSQLRYRQRSAVPPPGWDVDTWYLTVLVPLRAQADLDFLLRPTVLRTLRYMLLTAMFLVGIADLERPVPGQPASVAGRAAFSTSIGPQRALVQSPGGRSNAEL